ncbi:MAG: hypothetical protein OXC63_11515 [Aestuariivita sp.]|nr:hypothetical protein [Aestuariivita sp.]MCY4346119.1 hypothetical protein [Aestuariivita sp.]
MRTFIIFLSAILLNGCLKSTVIVNPNSISASANAPTLFYSSDKVATELKSAVEKMCATNDRQGKFVFLMTKSFGAGKGQTETVEMVNFPTASLVSRELETVKEIADGFFNIIPQHSFSIAGKCLWEDS